MAEISPDMGFFATLGKFDLYFFFESKTDRELAHDALKFFKARAKRHRETLTVSKWVLRSFVDTDPKAFQEVQTFFVFPEEQLVEGFGYLKYDYLRLFTGGSKITTITPLAETIIRIQGELAHKMRCQPLIRFFSQFTGYCGVLSDSVEFFTKNGTIKPWKVGISGLRTIEKQLTLFFDKLDEFSEPEITLAELVLDLMISTRFKKHDQILALLIKSSLPMEIRVRAVKMIDRPYHVAKYYRSLPSELKDELRYVMNEEDAAELPRIVKKMSKAHPEIPQIDIAAVKKKLLESYGSKSRAENYADLVAKLMFRLRENRYSKKVRSPEGCVTVLCKSVVGNDGRDLVVMEGQDPFKAGMKVRVHDYEEKELRPLGSLFAVWIPLSQVNTKAKIYFTKPPLTQYIELYY